MTWRPPVQVTLPASYPISREAADADLHLDGSDGARLERAIKAATARVEAITGTRLISQTISVSCTEWADLARLPIGPVLSIESIAYTDPAGDAQTLTLADFELRLSGLEPEIVAHDVVWPARKADTLITLAMTVGYPSVGSPAVSTIPEDVISAIRLLIAADIDKTNAQAAEDAALSLLINHRIGLI